MYRTFGIGVAALVLLTVADMAHATTIVVALDSTGDYTRIAEATEAAVSGDSILVRDGQYGSPGSASEAQMVLQPGVVLYAEHPGEVHVFVCPGYHGIELHGTAELHGLDILGNYLGIGQDLVAIYGGPAVVANCLLEPAARFGNMFAFRAHGQPPRIEHCALAAFSGANWFANNIDSTTVAMPGNLFWIQGPWLDTTRIHQLIRDGHNSPGRGYVFVSPVADTFQWLAVDHPQRVLPPAATVTLWPNPSPGPLCLELPQAAYVEEVAVYNLLGQRVWQQAELCALIRRLDFTLPLASGRYFLHVRGPSVHQTAVFTILK